MTSRVDPAVASVTVQYTVLHKRVFFDARDLVAALREANYDDAADSIKGMVEHFEQLAIRETGRR